MLTAQDICKRLGLEIEEVAYMAAKRILPQAIVVGDEYRWRVEDLELFIGYLNERGECKDNGIDPDSPDGPAPPVYSTGRDSFDPRAAMARIRERERQEHSKTLAAGSKPIAAEQPVKMPEVADTSTKVEG